MHCVKRKPHVVRCGRKRGRRCTVLNLMPSSACRTSQFVVACHSQVALLPVMLTVLCCRCSVLLHCHITSASLLLLHHFCITVATASLLHHCCYCITSASLATASLSYHIQLHIYRYY